VGLDAAHVPCASSSGVRPESGMSGRCSCSEHRLIRVAALTVGNCWAGHDPLSAPRRCPARNIGSAVMISSRSSALTVRAGHEMRSRLLPPPRFRGAGRCRAKLQDNLAGAGRRGEHGCEHDAIPGRNAVPERQLCHPGHRCRPR
jgi:hypothetical protein